MTLTAATVDVENRLKMRESPGPSPELLELARAEKPDTLLELGLDAARHGDLDRGLVFLGEAHARLVSNSTGSLPATLLSYYGLCLGVRRGQIAQATQLCQVAIDREFYRPDFYLNLARVWMAGGSRRRAITALDLGLAVQPANRSLQHFRGMLGVRRPPVLRFLGRDHPINVALGRLRHRVRSKAGSRAAR
jgi:hypothetical protein